MFDFFGNRKKKIAQLESKLRDERAKVKKLEDQRAEAMALMKRFVEKKIPTNNLKKEASDFMHKVYNS